MSSNWLNSPLLLVISGILIIIGILELNNSLEINPLFLFICAAIFHGYYFGINNFRIFQRPFSDDYYNNNLLSKLSEEQTIVINKKGTFTTTKTSSQYRYEIPELNVAAITNAIWVHIICSITGVLSLYILFDLHKNNSLQVSNLYLSDFILFIVGILGITGLLPMTLWFFANSSKILENLTTKSS